MLSNVLPRWLYQGNEPSEPASEPAMEKAADPDHEKMFTVPTFHVAEDSESESTPKAQTAKVSGDVPTLSLASDEREPVAPKAQPTTSFPAVNSAQRVSSMAPPPRPAPSPSKSAATGLMPPPSRPPAVPRGPSASGAASLRVPSTGPLPNRGPPANSQQRASSGLSPNGAVSTPNARGKVLLSPGHSPMDWAALTKTGNLAGVSIFQRVTPSELKKMTGRKGKPAWSSWQGKVYNITSYLPFHPGGEPELMKAAGRDGAKLFMEVHPWVNWENMLGSCMVGVLVPEGHGMGEGDSSMEDMD